MTDENIHPAAAAPHDETVILSWRLHLMRQHPERLPVVLGAGLFVTTVACLLFHNLLFIMAALLMLGSATGDYLLPISYRLTEQAAYCRYGANQFTLEWAKVRRALLYADGVRLTPLPTASRLDAFRGVYLRFAPDGQPGDRDSVLAAVACLRPPSQNTTTEEC